MYCDVATEELFRLITYISGFPAYLTTRRTAYSDIANVGEFLANNPAIQPGGNQEIDITDALLNVLLGDVSGAGFTTEEWTIFNQWLNATKADWSDFQTENHTFPQEDIVLLPPPRLWAVQVSAEDCLPQNSKRVYGARIRRHRVRGA